MINNSQISEPNTSRPSINQIRSKFTNLISSLGKNSSKLERAQSLKNENPQSLRHFRVDDYDAYTSLKQNIMNTFNIRDAKLHKEIFVLNKKLNSNQTQKVQKTMEKLSIKQKSRDNSLDNINTELISKMYIMSKSKQKRKQLMMSSRRQKKEQTQEVFFNYDRDNIRNFQRSFCPTDKDNSKHFKISQPKRRKQSQTINLKKPSKQSDNVVYQTEPKQSKSKSLSQRHPIVSIFDDQSSKMLKNFKNSRIIDLVQTQPYDVYDDDPQSIDYPLLPSIDIMKIRRKYQLMRNNLHLVKMNSQEQNQKNKQQ